MERYSTGVQPSGVGNQDRCGVRSALALERIGMPSDVRLHRPDSRRATGRGASPHPEDV
ncbi:MAG: hypothetical protein RQM90_06065 [Methanoculleus sp.]